MAQYLKMTITTPTDIISTAFKAKEYKQYIAPEVYYKYAKENGIRENIKDEFFKDIQYNFNTYSPSGKEGYSCKIDSILPRKTGFNTVEGRLAYAEYALTNYEKPTEVLENISEKLYEYKHIFNNRLIYLTSLENIQQAKINVKEYNNSIINFQQAPQKDVCADVVQTKFLNKNNSLKL